jgi:hypothetical protein
MLRTSERKDFKRCPQRWWWGWREGLKPRGSDRTPLWFGTGVHLGLAEWYVPGTKRGIHPAETFAKFAKDGLHTIKTQDATEEAVAEYEDGAVLGGILLNAYVEHYGQDESWDFIQAEKAFSLDVPWPGNDRQGLYEIPADATPTELAMLVYKGTWDGVYRDLSDGKIKLLETKTAAQISLTHLTLDDQAGSYWAIAGHSLREEGLIGSKERIHGITYNFLRKGKPDERPKDAEGYATNKPVKADYLAAINAERAKMPSKGPAGSWLGPEPTGKETLALLGDITNKMGITVLGERSKSQPPPLFVREVIWRTAPERTTQLRRIQNEGVAMQAYRDGTLPLIKNPTKDCSWDCSFFAMCELQERGGDWETFKKAAFKQMDPYADHRKSAES